MTGNVAVPTLALSFLAELSASPETVHLWLARTLVILAVIGAVIFAVAIIRGVHKAPVQLRSEACASLSIAFAFFALGCSTLVFTPPKLCGLLMLLVSAVGTTLAVIAVRQSERIGTKGLGIVGILANTAVQLLSLLLLRPGAAHLIDRLERSSRALLTAIDYSALVSAASLVGILMWLWLRQRNIGEQARTVPQVKRSARVWSSCRLVVVGPWSGYSANDSRRTTWSPRPRRGQADDC